jgi:hypothetical protein
MDKLIIIFLVALVLLPNILALECPKGLINDTYPGSCGLYTDSNKDVICDYSEAITSNSNPGSNIQAQEKITKKYNLLLISMISILLYLVSYFLSKAKKISPVFHKKFWNFSLLIGFLGAGFSGLFLVLNLEYDLNILWPFNLLFWHVETGIIMTIISIFHLLWHWSYFKSYLRIK